MCVVIDARRDWSDFQHRIVSFPVSSSSTRARCELHGGVARVASFFLRIHVYYFLHRSVGCIALDHLADARGGSSSRLASPSPSSSSSSS